MLLVCQRDVASLTLLVVLAQAGAAAGRWTPAQIHDTVAAIARQPAYATPIQQSILGRLLTAVFRWVRELFDRTGSWPSLRYVLIAAALALILFVLAGVVVGQRTKARRAAAADLRVVGAGPGDYWTLADQFDASGDFNSACHAIYRAVLDGLARADLIRLHASKTSGDYARALRHRGSPRAAEFWRFARQFERCVYGWGPPTHEDYLHLATAARAIVSRRAAA